MWLVRWIIFILFFLILVGFALQNQIQEVSVRVLRWETDNLPLWVFLYGAFVIGVLFSMVITILNIMRLKAENLKLQKQNRKVKEELNRLRNVNIEEDGEPFQPEENSENKTVVE
jgi:uncharacterized integral membrane protein